jgi:hypothetical protein
MNDGFLMIAGIGGVFIALVHGTLGHRKILSAINDLPPSSWRLNYVVFQLSTLYWMVGGIALLLTPAYLDDSQRHIVVLIVAFFYASGAVANFWATKGRHFGWCLLAIVATLAFFGA